MTLSTEVELGAVELVRDLNYLEQAEVHGDQDGAKFGEPAARAFLKLALKYARLVNRAPQAAINAMDAPSAVTEALIEARRYVHETITTRERREIMLAKIDAALRTQKDIDQ